MPSPNPKPNPNPNPNPSPNPNPNPYQDDVHPMIGETKVGGLWACNGFSGHGFKLAPAVGSLVAQQVTGLKTDAWETSVAHDFMGPYREPLTLKVKTHFA